MQNVFIGVSKPPDVCGWDKDFGEDLLCCEKTTSVENKPQEPQLQPQAAVGVD